MKIMLLLSTILMGIVLLHADDTPPKRVFRHPEPGKPQFATFVVAWKEVASSGTYYWAIEGTSLDWVKLYPETHFKDLDITKRYQIKGAILEEGYGIYHVWVYDLSEAKEDQRSTGPIIAASGTDEPLIPAQLNGVLPKIHPGMSTAEVIAVLSSSYPKVEASMSVWSGQTGYINYKLDDRFTLSIAEITQNGKEVVHDDLYFYLTEAGAKRRVEIKLYDWTAQSQKNEP